MRVLIIFINRHISFLIKIIYCTACQGLHNDWARRNKLPSRKKKKKRKKKLLKRSKIKIKKRNQSHRRKQSRSSKPKNTNKNPMTKIWEFKKASMRGYFFLALIENKNIGDSWSKGYMNINTDNWKPIPRKHFNCGLLHVHGLSIQKNPLQAYLLYCHASGSKWLTSGLFQKR